MILSKDHFHNILPCLSCQVISRSFEKIELISSYLNISIFLFNDNWLERFTLLFCTCKNAII